MESPRQSESNTLEYWKKQAKHYEQKANDIQQELDEYTENSAQLEKELEASLVQVEKQNRDLDHQNQRLKNEIEMLRNKLERSQQETNALENELQALKIDREKQSVYIRELEQKNDDLERGQRYNQIIQKPLGTINGTTAKEGSVLNQSFVVISESVSCIETLLNQAYERNAVLESEVDEIENLRVRLQRATDEARDLKQELKVMELVPPNKKEDVTNETILNGIMNNSSRTHVEIETQTSISSPQKREINGNAMTPSSRVSAINIVGDLLRKVGLERFLCRDCGKVKCSCDDTDAATLHHSPTSEEIIVKKNNKEIDENNSNDPIEYRKLTRQNSGPERDASVLHKPPPLVAQRPSEQPFVRSTQIENGKLRRSFAVRSREGLENLFSLASFKKGQEQAKSKQAF